MNEDKKFLIRGTQCWSKRNQHLFNFEQANPGEKVMIDDPRGRSKPPYKSNQQCK